VFARFNALLNGVSLDARQGDLYAPVAGERFDCIVAHPPYVPAVNNRFIFRDGGVDGEEISSAILAQAAAFLDTGGVLQCTCLVTARRGAPVLERVRTMFREAADQLDLIVLANGTGDRYSTFVRELLKAAPADVGPIVDQLRYFQSLGVERSELVTIVARRHGAERPGISVYSARTALTDWPALRWALDVHAWMAAGPRMLEPFMALRPRLSPHVAFDLTYTSAPETDEVWRQGTASFRTVYPLQSQMSGTGADAAFLGGLDGGLTFREILARLKAEGSLPAELPESEFAVTMGDLFRLGFIETDGFPFPGRSVGNTPHTVPTA